MNKIVPIVLILLAGNILWGQQLPVHEKKVFLAPNGNIYIQKQLPVYLWLSVDPDKSSEKYRLWSEETYQFSNPMYFDTEGWNTVRSPSAVDTSSRVPVYPLRDIVFEVYADSKPPKTSVDFGESKPVLFENKLQVGKGTHVKFSARDELSGVENIYYSVDGADYKAFTEDLDINIEKEYHIKYYAADNVGNVEDLQEITLIYDVSAPETKLEIDGDKYDNILSGRSKIKLLSDDKGTGIKSIYYAIDEGSDKLYTTPIPAAYISQDDHKISFYAIDKVGNREEKQEYSFYVDKSAPTIIEEIIGKSFFSGAQEFSSGKSRLKLTSFDNKSGVKEIRYSINNGEYLLYTEPVLLNLASGNMQIKTYAVDNVNNRSVSQTANEKTSIPYIDLTGPDLGYSFKGPHFESRDSIFISKNTSILLRGSDSESGLNLIEYRVNSGNPVEYTSPFSLADEGFYSVNFTGYDQVENSGTKTLEVKVDNTGPVISYAFGTTWLRKEEGLEVYPAHTVLFITATDAVVGYQQMVYSINGGNPQEYSGVIKNFKTGKTEIKVIAYDKLGNDTTKTFGFIIEQ